MATRTICPACEEYITLTSRYNIKNKLRCPHCYADLVVIQLNPLILDWDDDVLDDWDDDDDDEGEY